jgi:hypothetical protein
MAIQYPCPNCGKPIEVDDEFAGQHATCPYCRHAAAVPHQSTYSRSHGPTARSIPDLPGAAAPAPPPFPDRFDLSPESAGGTAGPRSPRQGAAIRSGTAGLIFCFGGLLLFAVGVVLGIYAVLPQLSQNVHEQPTADDLRRIQEDLLRTRPGLALTVSGLELGGIACVVLGLGLAGASLAQQARGNWRAMLSLAAGGLFLLCVCTGMAVMLGRGLI